MLFKERSSSTYPKVAGKPSDVVPVEAGNECHGGNFSSKFQIQQKLPRDAVR